MNSTQLLAQPDLVKEMEKRRLVLFTWGHDNNNVSNIQLQRDMGVAAVIYDWLAHDAHHVQWSLQIKDTVQARLLFFIRRLSSVGRVAAYYSSIVSACF